MKKILSIVAATALVSTSVMAFEPDLDRMYYGAAVALEDTELDDSGMAAVFTAGVPVMQINDESSVALEAEFTYTFASSEASYFGSSVEADLMTLGAYGAYNYNVSSEIFVKPRVGLIYKSMDVTASNSGFGYSASDSEIGLAFGVQAGYNISDTIAVTAGYNLVDGSDITHMTVGAQFRF